MVRRLSIILVVLAALTAVPAALAAYPAPYAVQGGAGLLNLDRSLRFVAVGVGSDTRISAVETRSGATAMSRTVPGSFGIPTLTQNGLAGGLFHDGTAFVLQSVGIASTTRFMITDTHDLGTRDTISLKGTFGFDALSPDGSRLYLIQHTSTQDLEHYVVRAYDLKTHALVPGRVADKAQKSWVMQGWAVSRVTTGDGRWAYTLYANPGGYPFIHALDTTRGVAHCIGLPWTANDQAALANLVLEPHGQTLSVHWKNGQSWLDVDTSTWRVSTGT